MDKNFFYSQFGTVAEPQSFGGYQIKEYQIRIPLVDPRELCPACGETISRNGKCLTCFECGWSSCEL